MSLGDPLHIDVDPTDPMPGLGKVAVLLAQGAAALWLVGVYEVILDTGEVYERRDMEGTALAILLAYKAVLAAAGLPWPEDDPPPEPDDGERGAA